MHCTVLMPAYNTDRWIGEAIQSVIKQTYEDWDLLIVDDGSTDSTANVAFEYLLGRNISLISLKENLGPAAATRIGIQYAQGPIITVVDSDDWILPHSLSTVMPYFEKDPDLGYAWTRFKNQAGKIGWSKDTSPGVHLYDALVFQRWWSASHQRFFRKEFYSKSVGLKDEFRIASDLQLAIVISSTRCNCLFIPEITYVYRMNRRGCVSASRGFQKSCADKIIDWARNGFVINERA